MIMTIPCRGADPQRRDVVPKVAARQKAVLDPRRELAPTAARWKRLCLEDINKLSVDQKLKTPACRERGKLIGDLSCRTFILNVKIIHFVIQKSGFQ
jgi:hypothetical protein